MYYDEARRYIKYRHNKKVMKKTTKTKQNKII